jgi:competence protein ComEA
MRLLRPLFLLLSLAVFAPHAFAGGIDLNTADAAALETLPGIGESKAAAIIQYRTDHGGFKSVDELDNVSGIGPSTLASVRDLVSVGGTATAGAPAAAATSSAATSSAATSTAAPASTSAGCPVNINKADAAALQNLPGIGESKAAAIVQYRTDHGAFAACDGLDAVSGIGPSTLATLAPCCSVQ